MGYYQNDLYNQPEQFGLTPIGELNDPDASWSFNDFVVWKHEDGSYYFGEDSGCSCPSPFEDYTSLEKASKMESIEQFEAAVKDYFNSVAPYTASYSGRLDWDSEDLNSDFQNLKADAIELIRKVAEGL